MPFMNLGEWNSLSHFCLASFIRKYCNWQYHFFSGLQVWRFCTKSPLPRIPSCFRSWVPFHWRCGYTWPLLTWQCLSSSTSWPGENIFHIFCTFAFTLPFVVWRSHRLHKFRQGYSVTNFEGYVFENYSLPNNFIVRFCSPILLAEMKIPLKGQKTIWFPTPNIRWPLKGGWFHRTSVLRMFKFLNGHWRMRRCRYLLGGYFWIQLLLLHFFGYGCPFY